MQLFDTHAHMDADRFDTDRAEILADMPKHQIRYLMNVGCDASSSLASVRLAGGISVYLRRRWVPSG